MRCRTGRRGPLPAVRIAAADPAAGGAPRPDRPRRWISLHDPTAACSKVVLARALRLVADGAAGRPRDPAPAGRRRPGRLRLSRRPDRRRRRLRRRGAGGRQPGAAGRALRRPGHVPAVRRFGARARPTPTSTPPTAPRWPSRPRTVTSTSWSSTTMRAALEPLCDDLTIAAEPQLSRTAAVWHLCTPITGRLRDTSTTAIDLALALHPTPAVGGVPTAGRDRADRRAGRRPRLLRRRGGLVRRRAATAAGWCRSAARSCRPTAAPRWPTPAAASSPNPTPMTKSTKPQRNSATILTALGVTNDRAHPPRQRPATRPTSPR